MSSPLLQLMGAYLNEDLFDVYGDVWSAVDAYVAEAPEQALAAATDLKDLLARLDEPGLASWCRAAGCGYAPSESEGGYAAWLPAVARRLSTVHA